MVNFTKSCGASFGVATGVVLFLEIVLSGIVGALCVKSWISEGKPASFFYYAAPKNNYLIRNRSLEACVILWCLSITLGICLWRVISAVVLFFCVKQNSVTMGQYWIVYKVLTLMISSFVGIASLTVPAIKIATLSSLAVDVITSYFIALLYPELDRMEKAIVLFLPTELKSEKSIENEVNLEK